MKQTLLRIALPRGKTLYPTDFRRLMAKQPGVPDDLFHYTDGKPSNGRPAVRFVGARGWVGIIADEENSPLIVELMGCAVRGAMDHCGCVVQAQIEEHEMGLTLSHAPKQYWISEMALKARYRRSREMDVGELAKERLLAAIESISARYGFDCPPASELGIELEVKRTLGMPIGKGTGPVDEYVTLVNAEFMIHADLKGMWFAGNLTARGYGRIGTFLPGSVR
ncbi:type IV CRISPR-associated endonuclease Csf5 [Duganella vulcania]|uniref:CRISPR-associated protein Cas6 C-terminal domain-containing protein n=1 Tax=Duganella vulcania TaxID=2692166 RepID=A0A845GHU6_9BURK|nr:type IV CRISPR-associated endonuclease Csf5 [Duganella vulcania]MYM92618.1 hypothetical protein [Duganella vulcania]